MEFNSRLEVALARVSKTGIWQSNYAPPIYHCLWFAGFETPPPHFASFGFNAIFSGTWFGLSWAAIMWFMFSSHQGLPPAQAIVFAIVVGAIFGLTMASYYAVGAWRYGLPRWTELSRN
ncbi:MAG TPA: DUF6404 family protein [Lacipirellulaceae bacterium]|nr:DUF6404 family protein [Lacipirellulaceae bacterium]